MSKKSVSIEMSEITKNGKKLKLGGLYLTNNGKLRAKFKGKFAIYNGKLYDTKSTKIFTFEPKQNFTGLIPDLQEQHGKAELGSATLLEDLAKKHKITGDNYIVIKRNNQVVRDGDFNVAELASKREEFNAGESPFKIWNNDAKKGDKIQVIFSKNKKIPKTFYDQKFLDGINRHCFLQDISDYYTNKVAWCEENGKSTKKYTGLLNKIHGKKNKVADLERFKDGISEKEMVELCEDYNIAIKIYLPFQKEPIIEYKPPANNFYGKTFNYTNTRLNHLEYIKKPIQHTDIFYRNYNPTLVDFERLQEIVAELHEKNELALCKKGCFGYISVKTKDNYYKVNEQLQDELAQFEKDTGLEWCSFDAVEYPLLDKFITSATHFNGTIDFQDTTHLDDILNEAVAPVEFIKHIDQTKAYTQFKSSMFYSGFVGKITDFRKCDKVEGNGFYYLSEIDWSNKSNSPATLKLWKLNQELGWFVAGNIYTKQELDCLTYFNVGFKIKYSAYGTRIDFDFPDYMFKKHEVKKYNQTFNIPYYALWTGMKASNGSHSSYYMKGDHRYFGRYAEDIYYNDENTETKIVLKNPTNKVKKHLTAQITAYQRLIMLEQLMEMDIEQLIRVCVDGIYYNDHSFKLNKCFREKTKLTFVNSPTECYLSNIYVDNPHLKIEELETLAEPRAFYKKEFYGGAGGTGKSYNLLNDSGFIHPVYIAPSWKLSAYPKGKFKRLVHYSINNDDKINNWTKKFNVYWIDEGSMITEHYKNKSFNDIMGRIFVMGDISCQLPPVISAEEIKLAEKNNEHDRLKQMTTSGFDKITTFQFVYRFKCEKLRKICEYLRDLIINGTEYSANTIKDMFQVVNINDLAKHYNYKEDIILVVRNKGIHSNETYNSLFTDTKLKLMENKNGYYNGNVVYEKIKGIRSEQRHGFTIHSVQGETYEHKIFMDFYHIFSQDRITNLKMFYTAVSRARTLDQIYIIS